MSKSRSPSLPTPPSPPPGQLHLGAMDELVQLQDGVLREQLAELQTARNNLGDIVAYCRGLYAEPNMSASHYGQAIEQSRTYACQSMSALAYQVNQCVHTLHELFQMHMGMVDEQCSDIGLLSERVMATRERAGREQLAVERKQPPDVQASRGATSFGEGKIRKLSATTYELRKRSTRLDLAILDKYIAASGVSRSSTFVSGGTSISVHSGITSPSQAAAPAMPNVPADFRSAMTMRQARTGFVPSSTSNPQMPKPPSLQSMQSAPNVPALPADEEEMMRRSTFTGTSRVPVNMPLRGNKPVVSAHHQTPHYPAGHDTAVNGASSFPAVSNTLPIRGNSFAHSPLSTAPPSSQADAQQSMYPGDTSTAQNRSMSFSANTMPIKKAAPPPPLRTPPPVASRGPSFDEGPRSARPSSESAEFTFSHAPASAPPALAAPVPPRPTPAVRVSPTVPSKSGLIQREGFFAQSVATSIGSTTSLTGEGAQAMERAPVVAGWVANERDQRMGTSPRSPGATSTLASFASVPSLPPHSPLGESPHAPVGSVSPGPGAGLERPPSRSIAGPSNLSRNQPLAAPPRPGGSVSTLHQQGAPHHPNMARHEGAPHQPSMARHEGAPHQPSMTHQQGPNVPHLLHQPDKGNHQQSVSSHYPGMFRHENTSQQPHTGQKEARPRKLTRGSSGSGPTPDLTPLGGREMSVPDMRRQRNGSNPSEAEMFEQQVSQSDQKEHNRQRHERTELERQQHIRQYHQERQLQERQQQERAQLERQPHDHHEDMRQHHYHHEQELHERQLHERALLERQQREHQHHARQYHERHEQGLQQHERHHYDQHEQNRPHHGGQRQSPDPQRTRSQSSTHKPSNLSQSPPRMSESSSMLPSQQHGPPCLGRVYTLYAYSAAYEGEMSVVAGEVLEVTAWDTGDGWTEGRSTSRGVAGIFPTAYVEKLEQ